MRLRIAVAGVCRPCFRHLIVVLLGLWIYPAASAIATTVATDQWTCPACGKKFSTFINPSYSMSGADDEGRPFSLGEDFQEFRIHDCPYCHYTGFGWNFPGETDVPQGRSMQQVRDALAKNAAILPVGALWPLERVRAAEICDVARDAEPRELERLYQLGAWLADDAAEDGLAAEFRDKSLVQRVRWATLDEKTGAAYIAGMRDFWAGHDQEAAYALGRIEPSLKVAMNAAHKQYIQTRKLILRRIRAESGAPPVTQEAADDSDNDSDWETIIGKATTPEQLSLWRPSAIRKMVSMLDAARSLAYWRSLGEAAAIRKAQAGGYDDREAYIRAYGRTQDPVRCAAIHKLIEDPFGPVTRPTTDPAKENPIPDSNSLFMLWERIDLAGSDLKPEGGPAEELRLLDELRDARSKDDSRAAFQASCGLAAHPSIAVADALLADLQIHPADYRDNLPLDDSGYRVWHVMAMDESKSAEVAARVLRAHEQKEIDGKAARAALRPLAYGKTDQTLATLNSAVKDGDPQIRVEAAKCLLWRNKPEAVTVFIAAAIDHPQELVDLEPSLAAALVRCVTSDDVPVLSKLNGQWPGPILRKDDDKKAMAAVVARAALAKADSVRFLAGYEKAVDELLASPIEGIDSAHLPWEDTVPQNMELLGWCANVYYVPFIGRQLRPMLAQGTSDYGMSQLIRTLAGANAEGLNDVLAGQVRRPLPLMVKLALIEARGRLRVDGINAALQRWKNSTNAMLSIPAREALKEANPKRDSK